MDKKTGEPEKPKKDFLESIVSKDKRVAVGRDAKWTAIGIAFFTLLAQQFALNMETVKTLYSPLENYLKPGVASLGDYITIGNTFLLSAPVILALALIIFQIQEKIKNQEGIPPGLWAVWAGLVYFAALIGNALGFTPVRSAGLQAGTPLAKMVLILGDLYNSYGLALFASSLIVGFFFARAWRTLATDL